MDSNAHQMDSFFFPTSPMFQPTSHHSMSEEECAGSEASHPFDMPDLLFLQPEPVHEKHNQQALYTNGLQSFVVPPPSNNFRQSSEYDWARMDVQPITVEDVYAHHDSSSQSSGSESGHSTPTFVAAQSPVQSTQMAPVQQQHNVYVPTMSVSVQLPSVRGPSMLEQFNCTIPEIVEPVAQQRPLVKVKRERGGSKRATAAASKKEKASAMILPVFTGSSANNLTVPRSSPSPSSAGYTSDSSHPSLHSHPLAHDGEENNEPSLGDDEETKRRKLSRKAELARLARKRKKTRLGDLEAEVARLEEELARAKRGRVERMPTGGETQPQQDADTVNANKMAKAVQDMVRSVHTGVAAQTAQMAVAAGLASHRSSSLTGSDASLGSVWSSLLGRELSLSPSSREYRELECFRTSMSSQHNFDGEIERTFAKMAQLFAKRQTQHSKNLNRIRSILDESQFCQIVEWMNRVPSSAAPAAAAGETAVKME